MTKDIGGVWRTVGGRRIFIKDGEDLATAMKNSGKFRNKKEKEEIKDKDDNKKNGKKEYEKNNQQNDSDNKENKKRILYHQTKAESLEDFSEDKRQSGLSDTSTPKGIFLKETDEDIGLQGKNQLKMEVTMEKSFNVKNREELKKFVADKNERYKNIIENENKSDDYYQKMYDKLDEQESNLYSKYYYATGKERQEYESKLNAIRVQQDDLIDQWENNGKNTGKIAQEEMTRTLKALGYDSVILEEDEGSFGRKVKSYIVFDIKQLKEIKKKK